MFEQPDAFELPQHSGTESARSEGRLQQMIPTDAEATELDTEDGATPKRSVERGWKRLVCLLGAGMFFVLGVLGALLPVLPATPFLLLTSYFLVRSSPRLNATLLRSRFLGPILTDWQMHGGVRRDVKAKAITVVAIAVAATVILSGGSLLPTLTVILLAAIGVTVIIRLPSSR